MIKTLLVAGIIAVAFNASAGYRLRHLSHGSSEISVSSYGDPADIKRLKGDISRFIPALDKAKVEAADTARVMNERCSSFFGGGCKKAEETHGRSVKQVDDYEMDLILLNNAVAEVEQNIQRRLDRDEAIAEAETARIAKYKAEQKAEHIAKQKADAERQQRNRTYNKRRQEQAAIAKAAYDALPPEAKAKACFKQADRLNDKYTDALKFAKHMYNISYAAWFDDVGSHKAREIATQQTDSDFRSARYYGGQHMAKLAECRTIKVQ